MNYEQANKLSRECTIHAYHNIRKSVLENIKYLSKFEDESPNFSESYLMQENIAYDLEHLFFCCCMILGLQPKEVDMDSHLEFMSTKETKKELARIDNYFQEKYFRKQVQELNN